jgi:hypothetical protein
MENQPETKKQVRRYVRVPGPFDGHHVGPPRSPVLVYDLNQGGGLVSFIHDQPDASLLELEITLPHVGRITVHAEPVSRQEFGIGVRFVDVDDDTTARLAQAVEALIGSDAQSLTTRH